jgi:hypothetical protein
MCFVHFTEKTAIISLYHINRLVFITEECVYSAVRTEYISTIKVAVGLKSLDFVKNKHFPFVIVLTLY